MQNLPPHSAKVFLQQWDMWKGAFHFLFEKRKELNFGWLVGTESLVQFSDEYTKLNSLLAVEMPEVHTVCRKNACLWSCLSAFGLWERLFSSLGRWLWSLAEITCPELSDVLIWASHVWVEASVTTDLFGWDKMGLLLQFWSRSFSWFEEYLYFETDFCKAFNTAPTTILTSKLKRYGFGG